MSSFVPCLFWKILLCPWTLRPHLTLLFQPEYSQLAGSLWCQRYSRTVLSGPSAREYCHWAALYRFLCAYSCLSQACHPYSAPRYLSDQPVNTFCKSKLKISRRTKKYATLKLDYPWSKKAKVVVNGMCRILKGIGIRSSGVNFFFKYHLLVKKDLKKNLWSK